MSTFEYILVVAGSIVVGLWFALAICFGIGIFGLRGSINAASESAARGLGQSFKPVSRMKWVWISISAVPLLLFGAAVVIVHFFIRY